MTPFNRINSPSFPVLDRAANVDIVAANNNCQIHSISHCYSNRVTFTLFVHVSKRIFHFQWICFAGPNRNEAPKLFRWNSNVSLCSTIEREVTLVEQNQSGQESIPPLKVQTTFLSSVYIIQSCWISYLSLPIESFSSYCGEFPSRMFGYTQLMSVEKKKVDNIKHFPPLKPMDYFWLRPLRSALWVQYIEIEPNEVMLP